MAKRKLAIAASLCALVVASPSAGAAWEPLATTRLGERKIEVFIDPDRIRDEDGRKMVWQLDNLVDDVAKDQPRSAVRLFALDCAKMSTALADLSFYAGDMGQGRSLGRKVSKTLEFEPALPDSIAEVLLFRVCLSPEQRKQLQSQPSPKPP